MRERMAYEDRKTIRNVEAQICTVYTTIAAMLDAAEGGVGVGMML